MKSLRVWFNKSFSSTFNVIARLASCTVPHRFHVLCSHTHADYVGFEPAAESFIEPAGLSVEDYLSYCLEFCQEHGVEVFMPGHGRIHLAGHQEKFAEIGVRLLVPAGPETLQLFEDKARFYETMPEAVAPVPRSIMVRTAVEFAKAVATLKAEGCGVCFKPSNSTGGLGFRILDDSQGDVRNLLGGENIRLTTALTMHIFSQEKEFRPVLVMEYLSELEYSVDCLAMKGRLLSAIPRRKPTRPGGAQILEDRADLIAMAGRIAEEYKLDGIFNVQARCLNGVAKVLEINARMSGGIYFACLSGVELPAWALAIAAGTASPEDVPPPKLGFPVHQQYQEFVLSNPLGAAVR